VAPSLAYEAVAVCRQEIQAKELVDMLTTLGNWLAPRVRFINFGGLLQRSILQ
jgi:hypothetical protein